MQYGLSLRHGYEETHIVQLVALKEVVERKAVQEALRPVHAVAVLVVVGGVVGMTVTAD